ncbi:hemolysin family protein [soil metagenome]
MIDDAMVIAALAVTAILIFLNAIYVFHEFSFVMIRPNQARRLANSTSRVTRMVHKGVHHLDHYIAVDQLGITVTSIAVGWVGQPAMAKVMSDGFGLVGLSSRETRLIAAIAAFLLLTSIQMIFGELMPKTVALRHPVRVAHLVALPVEITAKIFHPLVWLLNGIGGAAARALGFSPQAESHTHILPTEELSAVIEMSVREGALDLDPATMRRALHFSDLRASDILVPRPDVTAMDLATDVEHVFELARSAKFTRFPVYDESIDKVVGLLNIKDLVEMGPDGSFQYVSPWQNAVRPISTLPEHAPIEQVLFRLGEDRQQMALVVDEFGGTAGILTVADITRWLVADSSEMFVAQGDTYVLPGKTSLASIETMLGISFGEEDLDQDSIGGLIMAELQRIPEAGEMVTIEGHELEVVSMKGPRVTQVLLRPRKRRHQHKNENEPVEAETPE